MPLLQDSYRYTAFGAPGGNANRANQAALRMMMRQMQMQDLMGRLNQRANLQRQQRAGAGFNTPSAGGIPPLLRQQIGTKQGMQNFLASQFGQGNPGQGAPAGPSSGAPAGPLGNLLQEFQEQHDAANAANESRYRAIRGGEDDEQAAMGGLLGRYRKGMNLARAAQQQQYRHNLAAVNNDLVNRGLRASSLAGPGAHQAYEQSMQIPLQTHAALSGDLLGFMERKNENAPDTSQLVNLAMAAGQAQNRNSSLQQQMGMLQNLLQNQNGLNGGNINQLANQQFGPPAQTINVGMMAPRMRGGGYRGAASGFMLPPNPFAGGRIGTPYSGMSRSRTFNGSQPSGPTRTTGNNWFRNITNLFTPQVNPGRMNWRQKNALRGPFRPKRQFQYNQKFANWTQAQKNSGYIPDYPTGYRPVNPNSPQPLYGY